jgi:signal transduction histidine kinase/ActR/RegA family two-component response regulator
LSEARSEKELFQGILDATTDVLAPDAAAVFLFSEKQEKLHLSLVAAVQGGGNPTQPLGTSFPARIFPFIDDLQAGQKIVLTEPGNDPQISTSARKFFSTWGVSLAVFLPVGFRGHPVGLLFVGWAKRQDLPGAETTFLENLTAQLSITLDHLRLLREIQVSASESHQRSSELSLINRVVSAVSSSPDLHTACKVVVDELVTSFPVVSGAIGLLDEKRSSLAIIADQSRDGRTLVDISLPVPGNQSFEQVISTGEPLVIPQAQLSPLTRPIWELLRWRGIQSIIILPLVVGKEVIGAVILDLLEPDSSLGTEEIRLAQTIVYQAASSIQNTRFLERTQQALAQTELLYLITRSVAEAATPQDLIDLLVEKAFPAQADKAILLFLQEDLTGNPAEVEIVGVRDRNRPFQEIGRRYGLLGLNLLDQGNTNPYPVPHLEDPGLDPSSIDLLKTFECKSGSVVPLRTSGRQIGWILVSAQEGGEYTAQEIRLLQIVGDGIAIALDKMRLLQQTARRALELQTAATVARDTSGTLSLDDLLKRSVEMLRDRFGFYHASVFLLDETGTYAVVRESTGEAGQELKQRGHKLGVGSKSIIGTTTATGLPLVVNDVTRSDTHYRNPLLPDTQAELGIPLKIGDHVIGALDVQSTQANAFHADDVAVLQILADQIAVAIENARAYGLSQRAVEEMREVDQLKSKFLANMSHELRTPLNSIIGFSKVILKGIDGPITDIQGQDLTAIYNSGQHLLSLINDILDLSKVEAGKMELSFDEVNLSDLLNSVMSTAVGLVKDKPIKLDRYIQPDLPTVRGDSVRIRQVVINLMSNAAKFTERGAIIVEAAQQINAAGQPEVIVRVSDTGMGIAPEHQKKLFQPFSQVDDSPTRKTGGTGLGLSICRSLIDLHGGRIGLECSKLDEGSVFYFTLPVYRLDTAPVVEHAAAPVILVIDDDERVTTVYRQFFESRGFQVIHLADPHLALYHVRRLKPVAIVMDWLWKNPEIWLSVKQLKADADLASIPVLFSSLNPGDELGCHLGAMEIAFKPVDTQGLLNILARHPVENSLPQIVAFVEEPGLVESIRRLGQSRPAYQVTLASELGQDGLASLKRPPDLVIVDLFQTEANKQLILDFVKMAPIIKGVPIILIADVEKTPTQHAILSWVGQTIQSSGVVRQEDVLRFVDLAVSRYQKNTKR